MMLLVSSGIAIVVYATLACWACARRRGDRAMRLAVATAAAATAVWAAAPFLGDRPLVPVADLGRFVAWYGAGLVLYDRCVADRRRLAALLVGGAAAAAFAVASRALELGGVALLADLVLAIAPLVLAEHLYRAADRDRRWQVALFSVAIGALALYDAVLIVDLLLGQRLDRSLIVARPAVAILVAPLLALSLRRIDERRPLQPSRSLAFHSVVLIASGILLLALALLPTVLRRLPVAPSADLVGVAETCVLVSAVLGMVTLLVSTSSRNWLSRLVVANLFTDRFDYRRAWLACIETLSAAEGDTGGLPVRAIQALADIVDSPAGILLERDASGAGFSWSGSWNMPAVGPLLVDHKLARLIEDRMVVPVAELGPEGVFDLHPWLAVGLPARAGTEPRAHGARPAGGGGRLGIVLLAAPRGPFRIDDEVCALLGVVAREVATRLEADRATRSLIETRDLRAYGERFTFVAHDVKNVGGQLRLLASNARVHMDNPAFRADLLRTIEAATAKIATIVRRIETVESGAGGIPRALLLDRIEAACLVARSGGRVVAPATSERAAFSQRVAIPDVELDAVLTHVIDNASAAAGPGGTVRFAIGAGHGACYLDIIDDGAGMTPIFVRDELFRPFRSRTDGGSGIGAYQARQILRRNSGDLLVASSGDAGTVMRLVLPVKAAEPVALSA